MVEAIADSMQPVEICSIIYGASLLFVYPFVSRWTHARWLPALLSAALICAQIAFEGYRWHMIPVYAGLSLAAFSFAFPYKGHNWLLSVSECSLLVGILLCAKYPVIKFPTTTGRFEVGIQSVEWDVNGERLAVDVYYPAELCSGLGHKTYVSRAGAPRIASQIAQIKTNAIPNAPLAKSSTHYPLVLYIHSWNGNRHENTYLVENLSSHGFIVVAWDEPQSTPRVDYPNGEVVRSTPKSFLDLSSVEASKNSQYELRRSLNAQLSTVKSLLDAILSESKIRQILGHVDAKHVGALGFSFGGSVALEACRLDKRFGGCANLDGYSTVFGSRLSLSEPALIISSVDPTAPLAGDSLQVQFDKTDLRYTSESVRNSSSAYYVEMLGTEHRDFSDSPIFRSRLFSRRNPRLISDERVRILTNVIVSDFFMKYFYAAPPALLDSATKPQELHLLFQSAKHKAQVHS